MIAKRKIYNEEDKLSLLHTYYESGLSKGSFCRQYGLYSLSQLNQWLKKYAYVEKSLFLCSEQDPPEMSNRSKDDYKDENAHLKKRIKDLEKALAFSKLETESRDLMITRAEEYFNIPIRKKSGAK